MGAGDSMSAHPTDQMKALARVRVAYLRDLLASRYWPCGDDDAILEEIREWRRWTKGEVAA